MRRGANKAGKYFTFAAAGNQLLLKGLAHIIPQNGEPNSHRLMVDRICDSVNVGTKACAVITEKL